MKSYKISLILMMIFCAFCYTAYGYQAVGSMQGWNNNTSAWNLIDDGSHKLFTLTTTIPTTGLYQWKIVATPGDWSSSIPGGSNSWFQTTTNNQAVTFYYDLNVDSTWTPSSSLFYTSAQTATTGHYVAVGMQTWLGGPQDWDQTFATARLHDDGLFGDASAGDGIYTLRITFTTIDPTTTGGKAFKVAVDDGWDKQIGSGQEDGTSWGFNIGANQKSIASINSSDTIILYLDARKGRLKVSQTFLPRQGPPWYAIGDSQGQVLNSLTVMTSTSPGIYTRNFVSTFSSVTHWASVVDEQGTRFPGSSNQKGCYFSAVSGQSFLVTHDRTTALDGYQPYTKYTYTDASVLGSHTYTAVGEFQAALGGTSYEPTSLLSVMKDDGASASGDRVAGDNIYTFRFIAPSSVTTLTDFHYKVAVDQGWTLQIGNDGRSINGSPGDRWFRAIAGDTVLLEADVIKGRIKATNLNRDATPRPVLNTDNGNPGQTKIFTVTGITTIIGWSSSDTTKINLTGWTGSMATAYFNSIGSSTITVYDEYGLTDTKVVSVSATSAPLAIETGDFPSLSMPMDMNKE